MCLDVYDLYDLVNGRHDVCNGVHCFFCRFFIMFFLPDILVIASFQFVIENCMNKKLIVIERGYVTGQGMLG